MGIDTLIFIALAATVAILVLLSYAPLHSTFMGRSYSPRLLIAKLIAPFDIGVTLLLVMGTIVGLTTVTGIGNIIFNVATGLGLSLGAVIVRKLFVPIWRKKYEREKGQRPNTVCRATTNKAW